MTTTWNQISGPGTVTFANAAVPGTTATFSQAGTYVLRLSASDSLLTRKRRGVDHGEPGAAGESAAHRAGRRRQTITLPAGATLAGIVNDDGLPQGSVLTTTWSQVSGPGTVTFANAAVPGTTATFSQAGSYVLRLSASDSLLSTSDDVSITVNPAPPVNQPPFVNAGGDQTDHSPERRRTRRHHQR